MTVSVNVLSSSAASAASKSATTDGAKTNDKGEKRLKQEKPKSRKDVKILACSNARAYVANIHEFDQNNIIHTNTTQFSDGEMRVMIDDADALRGKKVVIVQSISGKVNDALMELKFAMDAVRAIGAREIYLLIPYLGYSRQDRVPTSNEAFSARVVAESLSQPYVKKIFIVKLHAPQIQGFFSVPTVNLDTDEYIGDIIKQRFDPKDVVLVAPDAGASKAIVSISKKTGACFGVFIKSRPKPGECEILSYTGSDVKGKTCAIVDDMVDTGGTLCNVAGKLVDSGAKRISAYMTHPVLSNQAVDKINESQIDEMNIGDTIESSGKIDKSKKIHIVSVADWCVKRVLDEVR